MDPARTTLKSATVKPSAISRDNGQLVKRSCACSSSSRHSMLIRSRRNFAQDARLSLALSSILIAPASAPDTSSAKVFASLRLTSLIQEGPCLKTGGNGTTCRRFLTGATSLRPSTSANSVASTNPERLLSLAKRQQRSPLRAAAWTKARVQSLPATEHLYSRSGASAKAAVHSLKEHTKEVSV
eukprot:CAMPEP_0172941740 /NCGR_PEP_ID=MMETSP1075-20121228/224691_1 /TAXON_ID=2916 /ORGANISM="Ceratium fusus, Strain PA161109" /LENGTH=183 /DNA_ID=CAMNT_0013803155 /DNA_START=1809 /DNA_END=2357 /DNA_ORIENTATION=+